MHWYLDVLKKYAVFDGRARRAEYWMFSLISGVIGTVLALVDRAIGTAFVLQGIYSLAVLVPGIAVSVRRLHDTSRTGKWLLLFLVPVAGWIALIVMFAQDSAPANTYGPNPKAAVGTTA
ncbi:DUF805 domain-containing protein [Streptomyces sp. PmtG]